MVAPLLLRLVDRADRLALAVAAGQPVVEELPPLAPFRHLGALDAFFLFSLGLCLLVIFGVLR
jgi:hypothetical protein